MRAAEIFEVEPIHSFMSRRVAQRVDQFWDAAPNHPQEAVAEAKLFYQWLQSHRMTGEADLQRKQLLRQVYDFLDFMR